MEDILSKFGRNKIQRKADGYVNATALAKINLKATGEKKDPSDWLANKSTKSILDKLSEITRIPVNELVSAKQGQGTWIHPRLAVRFTMWLNEDFSLQIEDWVHEWFNTGKNPVGDGEDNRTAIQIYSDRVHHSEVTGLPDGYWYLLEESDRILLDIEKAGYKVSGTDTVEISIAYYWNRYRKGKPWQQPTLTFHYRYPKQDRRRFATIEPNAYHLDELPHFKRWLRSTYKPMLLPKYLKTKYGEVLARKAQPG